MVLTWGRGSAHRSEDCKPVAAVPHHVRDDAVFPLVLVVQHRVIRSPERVFVHEVHVHIFLIQPGLRGVVSLHREQGQSGFARFLSIYFSLLMPAIFAVRLVGTTTEKLVHWQKMRRIAGPGLFVSQAVQNSALHDLQRFLVESIDDWGHDEDGETVKVLVRCQG